LPALFTLLALAALLPLPLVAALALLAFLAGAPGLLPCLLRLRALGAGLFAGTLELGDVALDARDLLAQFLRFRELIRETTRIRIPCAAGGAKTFGHLIEGSRDLLALLRLPVAAQALRRVAHAFGKLLPLELARGFFGGLAFVGITLAAPRKPLHAFLQTLRAFGQSLLITGKAAAGVLARLRLSGLCRFVGKTPLRVGKLLRLELQITESTATVVGTRRLELPFELAQAFGRTVAPRAGLIGVLPLQV
jgi:hypothetical protein